MGKRNAMPPPSPPPPVVVDNPLNTGRGDSLLDAWEMYKLTHQQPELVQVVHDRLLHVAVFHILKLEERLSSLETKPRRRRSK